MGNLPSVQLFFFKTLEFGIMVGVWFSFSTKKKYVTNWEGEKKLFKITIECLLCVDFLLSFTCNSI